MAERLPKPPIDADADLRHFPHMPLDIVALQSSDTWAIATGAEAKALVNLWMKAWHQVPTGSLPDDERLLAAWAAVPDWHQVRELVLGNFVKCSDGRLYQMTLCGLAAVALKRSRSGAKSANARWNKRKPDNANASSTHMRTGYERNANAMLGKERRGEERIVSSSTTIGLGNTTPRARGGAADGASAEDDRLKFIGIFDRELVAAFGESQQRLAPHGTDWTTAGDLLASGVTVEAFEAVCRGVMANAAAKARRPPQSLRYVRGAALDAMQAHHPANGHAAPSAPVSDLDRELSELAGRLVTRGQDAECDAVQALAKTDKAAALDLARRHLRS